ncbi:MULTISPECIES: glucose 1-dehydrogenase [unclassified Pseudonocardia]|uniref:SDR family NAD(P)-dependent oxidoreductase n=1 Tax=unclassified Pseudonocardia TaxID=2619320 RepID=UPI000ADE7D1F|nr:MULTISPECIES: glucose 1-dehydrogenase [unclassified Pseudonocardia]
MITIPPSDSRFSLAGKVAVVTGGSRGLGQVMAHALAVHGADVVVASRKGDACDAVAARIAAVTGRDVRGFAFHAGRWPDCDRLADWAFDTFGHIEILVNNAGMSPLYPSLDAVTEELFDKVLAVNLKGAFRLSALFGTKMAAAGGGSIINIGSVAAIQPQPNEVPYAAAKAGLNAMTVGLAHTFGPSVRANVIMPGPFLTDVSKAWDMDGFERKAQGIPLRRGGRPEEIAGAAVYLASDASSFTTGAVLKIDGGYAHATA